MPYQVSMMGWVGSGFEKVTYDQLCTVERRLEFDGMSAMRHTSWRRAAGGQRLTTCILIPSVGSEPIAPTSYSSSYSYTSKTSLLTCGCVWCCHLSNVVEILDNETRVLITARRVCIARTIMPWQDVCPSVCLSVCHMPVFCQNG